VPPSQRTPLAALFEQSRQAMDFTIDDFITHVVDTAPVLQERQIRGVAS